MQTSHAMVWGHVIVTDALTVSNGRGVVHPPHQKKGRAS